LFDGEGGVTSDAIEVVGWLRFNARYERYNGAPLLLFEAAGAGVVDFANGVLVSSSSVTIDFVVVHRSIRS
jgi:hypothetical protein